MTTTTKAPKRRPGRPTFADEVANVKARAALKAEQGRIQEEDLGRIPPLPFEFRGVVFSCSLCPERFTGLPSLLQHAGEHNRAHAEWVVSHPTRSGYIQRPEHTECRRGHPYEGNIYISKQGVRRCRICTLRSQHDYLQRKQKKPPG